MHEKNYYLFLALDLIKIFGKGMINYDQKQKIAINSDIL